MSEENLLGAILAVVVTLFFISCMSELIDQGNFVFETCKVILPSITTLILGYLFGKGNSK